MKMARNRLRKDLKSLQRDPVPGISVGGHAIMDEQNTYIGRESRLRHSNQIFWRYTML